MINAGGSYKITNDIVVGDQVAFRAGEIVVVEYISPNPQRPESQFVVLSQSSQQRYQLREIDLAEIAPAAPYPVTTVQGPARQAPPQKAAPTRRKWRGTAIAMLIMLVIGAVGGFLLAKQLDKSETTTQTSKVTTPKKQGSSTSTPSGSKSAVSQVGPKPDLSKPDPNAQVYTPAIQTAPITIAQYDLLKGGMSEYEVREAMSGYEPNLTSSTITLTDANRTVVPVVVEDWKILGDAQGFAKAKLVDDKLVDKCWVPSSGQPSWVVY